MPATGPRTAIGTAGAPVLFAAPKTPPESPQSPPGRASLDKQAADVARARIEAARTRRLVADQAIKWLTATFPNIFGSEVKPLAIGVGKLIWPAAKAAGIPRRALNDALKRRTSSIAYLDALIREGAVRCDLDGAVADGVSADHRALAIEMKAEAEQMLATARTPNMAAGFPHPRGPRQP